MTVRLANLGNLGKMTARRPVRTGLRPVANIRPLGAATIYGHIRGYMFLALLVVAAWGVIVE
jgi:hypothetical protein